MTVDFDSLEDHAVTIRERDAMTQERVAIDAVSDYLAVRLKGADSPASRRKCPKCRRRGPFAFRCDAWASSREPAAAAPPAAADPPTEPEPPNDVELQPPPDAAADPAAQRAATGCCR